MTMTITTTSSAQALANEVPTVSSTLTRADRVGAIKARLGMGRMDYRVAPGLYRVGTPTPESPVLVSANYKLSFDVLRSQLQQRNAWLLVLDTNGINVWCAAGKGTFGTGELVRRVEAAKLAELVTHRKLVVPQLGAPGVSGHEVRKQCGFRVVYGPVRASDLPAFLDARMRATDEMRRVRFPLRDRVVLIPVEIVGGFKPVLIIAALLSLLSGLNSGGYGLAGVRTTGMFSAGVLLTAFFGGAILGPILLPWLPGRAFSIKGAVLGLTFVGALAASVWPDAGAFASWLHLASWALIVPALVSFVVMNFTGASTYTSLSGVLHEMRIAVPAQASAALVGVGLWIAALFLIGGSVS